MLVLGALASIAAAGSTSSVRAQSVPAQSVPAPSVPAPPDDSVPPLDLGSEPLHGEEAVAALDDADATEQVAASVDATPGELVEGLLSDASMFVAGTGMVGFRDDADAHALAGDGPAVAALDARTTRPEGLTGFDLDSKPGAGKVIFLDFDGHTTNDSAWSFTPIASAPFDRDGNPGSFSESERDDIYEVWQRVAEDYAPFDVNVTTRDPGIEALRKTSAGDASYGQRVVISPTRWAPFADPGTIGVAFVGSFDAAQDRSAFVFTSHPPFNTPRVIGEAASHEAGHTLGLNHDGVAGGTAYYSGHGVWAPIMGFPVNVSTPVTQWSRGEYANPSNVEDDVAILGAWLGHRADDVGNSSAAANVVSCASSTDSVIGVGDVDVFAVDVGAGVASFQLRPIAGWSNLLARIDVRNSGGTVVASGAPVSPTNWSAAAAPNLPAGRYTIEVRPIGWLTANDGFTTYGSMGQYRLDVAAPAPPGEACTTKVTPVTPNRVLDTRHGIGGSRRVPAGRQVVVQVAGTSGVPVGASAAVVNITAVSPSGWGFLTAFPCTDGVPDTSNVNYVGGQIVSNNTIAALSPAGQLCVWTYAETDILVDVTGWLGANGASRLTPVGPNRVVDTRRGLGGPRVAARGTLEVDFTGRVPAGTTAVSFNVTATRASEGGFMTAYPCGQPLPDTSVVNYVPNEDRPNNVIVGLGAGNRVCIYSYGSSDVIVDHTGSFSPAGLSYLPTPPDRLLDTRAGGTQPAVAANTVLGYSVVRPRLGSLDADAAFVNVTATEHPRQGFVTTFDCTAVPDASTVNQRLGQDNANGAIVPLTGDSRSCAWMSDVGHLIVDLNGWWVR